MESLSIERLDICSSKEKFSCMGYFYYTEVIRVAVQPSLFCSEQKMYILCAMSIRLRIQTFRNRHFFLMYTLSNSFTNLAMKPTSVVWDLWTTLNGRIVLVCGIKWITATFKKMNSLCAFLQTSVTVHGHSHHSFKNAFNLFNVYTGVSIDSNILHHMSFFKLLEKLFQRMAQVIDFWWKTQ